MIKIEATFAITEPQDDGSERFFHDVKGWVKDTSETSIVTLVREVTNVQAAIAIVAFREIA
jgi:hypothetical protein